MDPAQKVRTAFHGTWTSSQALTPAPRLLSEDPGLPWVWEWLWDWVSAAARSPTGCCG